MTSADGLVDACLSSLVGGEQVALPDHAAAPIEQRFLDLMQTDEARPVLEAFVALSYFLHRQGADGAADRVLSIARLAVPILDARGVEVALPETAASAKATGAVDSKVPVGARGGAGPKWWQVKK